MSSTSSTELTEVPVTEYIWFTHADGRKIRAELKRLNIEHDSLGQQSSALQIIGTPANLREFFVKITEHYQIAVDRFTKLPVVDPHDDHTCEGKIKMSLTAHFSCDKSDAEKKIKNSGDKIKKFDVFASYKSLQLEINLTIKNSELCLIYKGVRDSDDNPPVRRRDNKRIKEKIIETLEKTWDATCILSN
jgi:hypothetical protein